MFKRLLLVWCLTGCAIQPQQTEKSTPTPELRRMEMDLLINLWLHTSSEVKRLQTYLERRDISPEQREAALVTLTLVQRQSEETWLAIFKE